MKIFLSSTFIDLRDHRKAVDEIINRLSHQYRGMEYFGSREFDPKHVCFEEITACDLFIGIYAHRYGWIPEKDTKSITEQEYDFAQTIGIPCLLYVIKSSFPWNPEFVDDGQIKQQLAVFKDKIRNQVISEFTTPDDLSKQIAADIANTYKNSKPTQHDIAQLCASLNKLCLQDIKTNIGPKYISDLFVKRIRSRKYAAKITSIQSVTSPLLSILDACQKIHSVIQENKEYKQTLNDLLKKPHQKEDNDKPCEKILVSLSSIASYLQGATKKSFVEPEVCFPAIELTKNLEELRKILNTTYSAFSKLRSKDKKKGNIISNIDKAKRNIGGFIKSIKPITMLVDRAGGGKTNLLCDLAIELSLRLPVFFISAKSVAEPTEKAILEYIKHAYPISSEPIEYALAAAFNNNSSVLLIIDGINEHYNPASFNLAMKAFVQRYYGKPIRYLISCRDIYWRFFEDDWWTDNSEEIIRNELYSFRANEFKSVLPRYLESFHIDVTVERKAKKHLCHPLLLRFFCEAYKGRPSRPTMLGIVSDVRLLPLFDTYCQRKYAQIRERLCLASTSEISEFVSMLGLMMLSSHTRLLPLEEIRKRTLLQFGEGNLYSSKSKYVQILDEDIVIEQVPVRSVHNLNVEFVYDEFMEYVIATAKYTEIYKGSIPPGINDILCLVDELLKKEQYFVSISGVLIFIGEIVAERSKNEALVYIQRLMEKDRKDLVCKILSRWPEERMTDEIVDVLISLHRDEKKNDIRNAAWQALEEVYWRYWNIIFDYITTVKTGGFFRSSRIYSFLKRTKGGVTIADRFRTLCWIGDNLKHTGDRYGGDFKSGVSALQYIANSNRNDWNIT